MLDCSRLCSPGGGDHGNRAAADSDRARTPRSSPRARCSESAGAGHGAMAGAGHGAMAGAGHGAMAGAVNGFLSERLRRPHTDNLSMAAPSCPSPVAKAVHGAGRRDRLGHGCGCALRAEYPHRGAGHGTKSVKAIGTGMAPWPA